MAPRQRKDPRLPDGLRERDGYYSYTNPVDGREYGIGRDRRKAFQQAMEANAHLAGRKPSLLQRITGAAETWGAWCDVFEKIIEGRGLRSSTIRTRRSLLKYVRSVADAETPASQVSTKDCSKVLDGLVEQGKRRMAQSVRSMMIDSFNRMKAKGLRIDNPADVTDSVRVKVKRSRLPFSAFMKLYETTSIVWLRNAMALALVAGKDRDSVRNAKFTDFRDGGWWNERSKTENRVFLPVELRLHCFGMSLDDVVRRCRTTGIVSRYLIHHTERDGGVQLGKPIHLDLISRRFTSELAKLNLEWGEKEPPTFHEIRSLAARLYKDQGDINPQDLLSHKDPKSTALYTDGRGEWVRLRVPK